MSYPRNRYWIVSELLYTGFQILAESLRCAIRKVKAVMAFALNRGTARRKKHCHPAGSATRYLVTR